MRLIELLLGLLGVLLAGIIYWTFIALLLTANMIAGGLMAIAGMGQRPRKAKVRSAWFKE